MPRNKDLKRLVRSRMQKTGESYTTARAQITRRKQTRSSLDVRPTSAASTAVRREPAALAGMSDDAVRAKTGRTWLEWVATLDAIGAASLPHREIASRLNRDHGVPGWWSQMVTVGYERIRGLREVGQRRGGTYEANKSKTMAAPVARLYKAFTDARTRRRWLPGVKLTLRKATPHKYAHITWPDGTNVDVGFSAKGAGKSQVAVQHAKLATRAEAERLKEYWAERLAALAAMLAPQR
jgi:hypothetical protein